MDQSGESILNQELEKYDALLGVAGLDVKEQMLQARSQSLKEKLVSFLVDSRYALKLDEII
ncbi:hypothetical protein G6672_06460 [Polynucleobacter paneuropaeus]|nr:hypothetical protein [Polynucleobacter paneuropaeus]MBT8595121.1 hypothetical protein [Polynucleobacter paneuropaeus]MBT8612130.1 hypothetical protein [Polynucleobacter paneuropaeus]